MVNYELRGRHFKVSRYTATAHSRHSCYAPNMYETDRLWNNIVNITGKAQSSRISEKIVSMEFDEQPRNRHFTSTVLVSLQQLRLDSRAARLLLVHLDRILIFHLERFRRFIIVYSATIEEKAQRTDRHANAIRVGFLELAHLRRHLDAKVNLVAVLADDFELDVLASLLRLSLVFLICHLSNFTNLQQQDVFLAEIRLRKLQTSARDTIRNDSHATK